MSSKRPSGRTTKPTTRAAKRTAKQTAQATTKTARQTASGRTHQGKVGRPAQPRGQQMGDERSAPDKTLQAKKNTPALRGDRPEANKFFADKSSQHFGAGGEAPSDNAPSVPAAIPVGEKLGESGGERVFKRRQAAKRR